MPDIRIHRDHHLGLARARDVALQWAEEVERSFGMECSILEGETSDTVEFHRTGVKGRLIVAADHFDLEAKLGFLLGAFSRTIETEIEKNLDALLGSSQAAAAGGRAGRSARAGAAKAHAPTEAKAPTAGRSTARAAAKPATKAPAKAPRKA